MEELDRLRAQVLTRIQRVWDAPRLSEPDEDGVGTIVYDEGPYIQALTDIEELMRRSVTFGVAATG
jgi:hypothetical protein